MRSFSVLLAVLVAAFLPSASAQDSSASGQDEVLQLLIEKAKERERLFDNVEVKSRREEHRSDWESPRIFHDSWARNGPNRKITYKFWLTDSERISAEHAETGGASRGFSISDGPEAEGGRWLHGTIGKAENLPLSTGVFSPEQFGVAALPLAGEGSSRGMSYLANFLNPEARPMKGWDFKRELHYAGEETIDGRTFLIVEEKTIYEPTSFDGTVRVYFDPKLNYACVMVKVTKKWAGHDATRTDLVTMDDFQEIKPGLFVPYTMSNEYTFQSAQPDSDRRMNLTGKITQAIETIEWWGSFDEGFFDIEFPVGTRVVDLRMGDPLVFTIGGKPASRIDIDEMLPDLEEIEADIEEAPAEEIAAPAADTAEPEPAVAEVAEDAEEPSGDESLSGLFGAGIVIILLAVAAFLFLKRRKRS